MIYPFNFQFVDRIMDVELLTFGADGATQGSIQGKATTVAIEVEHMLADRKRAHKKPAIPLVRIETSLLSQWTGHKLHSILADADILLCSILCSLDSHITLSTQRAQAVA